MVFFVVSMIMYIMQNIANKHFSINSQGKFSGVSLVQNGLCTLSSAMILMLTCGFEFMSARLTLLAVLFGATYLLTIFALLKAFTLGSMGISNLLCNTGMFISSVYGIVRFGDEFSTCIALGGACMFFAVLLSVPSDKMYSNGGLKWFAYALLAGIANGAVASVKREVVALCPDDIPTFLMWGFFFAAVIAFVVLISTKTNRSNAVCIVKKKSLLLCGVGAGVATAGANLFQMLALKIVSSAIVYPFTAGVLVVSIWLLSVLVYKETKPKIQNIISVVLCVAAIILINIK